MDSIMKRINLTMDEKQLKYIDLAKFLGVNQSVVSTWKREDRDPPAKYIIQICDFLGIDDIHWFLTGEKTTQPSPLSDEVRELLNLIDKLTPIDKIKLQGFIEYKLMIYKEEKEKQIEESRKIVPFAPQKKTETKSVLLRGLSSAGSPLHHFDDLFYTDYVETEEMRADFAWKISGNSMEPLIEDGEIIFTRSVDKNEISNGDIVVVRVNGEYTCKKIYVDLKKQKITLRSVNPNYPDQIYYFGDDTDTIIRIEGKVL